MLLRRAEAASNARQAGDAAICRRRPEHEGSQKDHHGCLRLRVTRIASLAKNSQKTLTNKGRHIAAPELRLYAQFPARTGQA